MQRSETTGAIFGVNLQSWLALWRRDDAGPITAAEPPVASRVPGTAILPEIVYLTLIPA
jgi:hypothetical protein